MAPPYRYIGGALATPNSVTLIEKPSDLSGPLDSKICYVVDGILDMLGTSIPVPPGGLNIQGCGFGVSILTDSTTNAVLFTGDTAGKLFVTDLEIEVTGTGAKVFDLTNDGTAPVELNTVNFNNCVSLGSLATYRQILMRNVSFTAPGDGIEFAGAWSGGVAIVDTILLEIPSGVTMFKAGPGFLVGSSVRSNINAIDIDDNAAVFDFSPANFTPDGSFSLNDFRTNKNSNALPNMPSSSVKSNFSNCRGIRNTYPGGAWNVTTEVATTFSESDTLVKMAGATTYVQMEWFSNTTDNAFVYDSDIEIDVIITGILTFAGTANNEMVVQLRHWDASASGGSGAYVAIGDEFKATLNAGGRGENLPFRGLVTMNKNDRIEVWLKNITGTSSITAILGGDVGLIQRPS